MGTNNTTQSFIPVKVLKGAYSGTTYLGDNPDNPIIAVAVGHSYSVALAEDGCVYTWGYNYNGELGNDDEQNNSSYVPVKVVKGAYSGTAYLGDSHSNPIVGIATGNYHCLALAEDGTVYAWGYNETGELGDNSYTEESSNIPIRVLKGEYSGTTYWFSPFLFNILNLD